MMRDTKNVRQSSILQQKSWLENDRWCGSVKKSAKWEMIAETGEKTGDAGLSRPGWLF